MHMLGLLAAIIDTSGLPKATANDTKLETILNLVFALAASIAVLMIVISGFRYIVAHGDPSATAQARNGLLYSVIGLVIVMTAFAIVTFVVKGIA